VSVCYIYFHELKTVQVNIKDIMKM